MANVAATPAPSSGEFTLHTPMQGSPRVRAMATKKKVGNLKYLMGRTYVYILDTPNHHNPLIHDN